ncbi:hypothetical protein ACJZ2D_004831 [Fusarium nematophilum]
MVCPEHKIERLDGIAPGWKHFMPSAQASFKAPTDRFQGELEAGSRLPGPSCRACVTLARGSYANRATPDGSVGIHFDEFTGKIDSATSVQLMGGFWSGMLPLSRHHSRRHAATDTDGVAQC